MRGNRGVDTKPEVALRSVLHRAGLRFLKNSRPGSGLPRVDILLRGPRVAVFVDGCFWHCCPQHGTSPKRNTDYWSAKLDSNVERDRRNDAALIEAGWRVVRVWEHEDPAEASLLIERLCRGSRPPGAAGRR
jgi:DNA mismatch endonuclease (patch repair protein)